jgi:lipopolysaccharide export LptBFGC system permease protein LptF
MIPSFTRLLARVLGVSRQWFQIVAIWVLVLIGASVSMVFLSGDARYTAFGAIAAASIALVSLEHLISSKSKDTVRQQVYVSAGTLMILGLFTIATLAS